MEGSRDTARQPPLNHRASQQTIISLLELDPSPIESPTLADGDDEKHPLLHDDPDTDGSDTIMAASADSSLTSSTATAVGLSSHAGGHGTIFYLSRIQRYSSYAMSLFTTLHLANVSLIPAVQRSVAASETYLLMTREIYQTALTEPLLVALPVAAHVGAGIGLRLLRRRENVRRYGAATPATYALHRARTERSGRAATASPWPPLSYISASGYGLSVFYAAHVFMNRVLPLAVDGDSANVGLAYVAHGFARHPVVARVAYGGLITAGMGHMVWGLARWWGYAPSTRGWRSPPIGLGKEARRERRSRWFAVHAAALLAAAAWAVGGLAVVARGGPQDGWVGKVYDDMFARVGL